MTEEKPPKKSRYFRYVIVPFETLRIRVKELREKAENQKDFEFYHNLLMSLAELNIKRTQLSEMDSEIHFVPEDTVCWRCPKADTCSYVFDPTCKEECLLNK